MSFLSPPPAPSPQQGIQLGSQIAQGQQGYNTQAGIQSQAGSQYNQFNPYGSVQYSQTGTGPGGVPIYSANVNLSPEQQALFNTYQGTQGLAGNQGQQLLAGANYGAQSPTQAIGDMTSGLTGQMMGSWLSGVTPFFGTQTSQLDNQLRNQGLVPGTPGYDNAMRQQTTSQGLSVEQSAAQFQPQAFGEATNLYQMPMQMGTALAQFGQGNPGGVLGMSAQAPALNIQPANLVGATSNETQALQNQYAAQEQQYQGLMSGLFGTAGTVLGAMAGGPFGAMAGGAAGKAFSDRRLKHKIKRVGKLDNGLPVYSFEYLGNSTPQIGLMADEVERLRPEAVTEVNGIKLVDYNMATR